MNSNLKQRSQPKKKVLVIYLSGLVTSSFFITSVVEALPNDLNIYRQPQQGVVSLLLMLDSSAGMDDNDGSSSALYPRAPKANGTDAGSIYLDYPECRGQALKSISTSDLDIVYGKQQLTNGTYSSTFAWNIPYCGDSYSSTNLNSNNATTRSNEIEKIKNFKYSRQDRMKIAMSILLGDESISSQIRMGLGQMSAQSPSDYIITATGGNRQYPSGGYFKSRSGTSAGTYHAGGNDVSSKILIPAQTTSIPLDGDQRFKLRVAVTALDSGGTAPIASALAEAGAYMLGKTTLNPDKSSVEPNAVAQFQYSGAWYGPYSASGFNYSNPSSKKTTNPYEYQSPIPSDNASCNSNGIFLLTNAAPTQTPRTTAQTLMRNALNEANFTCPENNGSGMIKQIGSGNTDFGWTCMGAFAKKLYENSNNIKVAVAGFGNNFSPYMASDASIDITEADGKVRKYYKCNALKVGQTYTVNGITTTITQDTINACNLGERENDNSELNADGKVGGYGQGGFYPIISPQNLVDAIKNFVANLESSMPALNTGLPAIPIDTLNLTQPLPFAYYAQFQPNMTNSQAVGIWVGNIKKYMAKNNTFVDKNDKEVINPVTGNLNSTTDFWSNSSDGADVTKGGVYAKLPVQTTIGRQIYTNRSVSGNTVAETVSPDLTLIGSKNDSSATGTAESLRKSNDPDKAYLLNLLGFGISATSVPSTLTDAAKLRQMGAPLNSTPLFFTTQSQITTKETIKSENGVSIKYSAGEYIDRKNYILFGTIQGLLQVVDASSGEEKFVFLPKEMIDRQKYGFIAKSLQTGSNYTDLYQGIDGTWSAYANYISNNNSHSIKADTLNVYGGLRRGGASYYGLDLKNIESGAPKLLFKTLPPTTPVNPITGIPTGSCSNTDPLNCMGQSWSKPTIGWIKWKGIPQLVMIVGGGYDPVYDSPDYLSNSNSTKGNGIYIFAADNNVNNGVHAGELLWWGSSSAITSSSSNNDQTQKMSVPNLKYSVVSEVKAIDRNGDDLIDNLYFGDLGGQVFRADIDNSSSSTNMNFSMKRVVRIANFISDSERSVKVAPRFYSMPTFTVHKVGDLKGIRGAATRFAVISIGSGDVSSPVSNSLTIDKGTPDRVYGIFDRDVGRKDLYTLENENDLSTRSISISNMLDLSISSGENAASLENMTLASTHGWFNTLIGDSFGRTGQSNIDGTLASGIARYKILSNFSAIKNTLFTGYFDAADNGTASSCGAGIRGRSYVKNYCLPFGSIKANGENCGTVNDGRAFSSASTKGSEIGAGVIPVIIGGMSTSDGPKIGPISNNQNPDVSAQFKTPIQFNLLRWYEKNS